MTEGEKIHNLGGQRSLLWAGEVGQRAEWWEGVRHTKLQEKNTPGGVAEIAKAVK